MENTKLAPPWIDYVSQLEILFEKDNHVSITYDDENKKVTVYVDDDPMKAEALDKLLSGEVKFGNVAITVTVVPNNEPESVESLFRKAFYNNPIVDKFVKTDPPFEFNYMLFKKEVVQYYNDAMNHPEGLTSTLYQNLAKEVFSKPVGMFFGTSAE